MSIAAFTEMGRPARVDAAVNACIHCGLPLPPGTSRFCCNGCAGAFRLIEKLGLKRYYDGRILDTKARPPRPEPDETSDVAAFTATEADGTHALRLIVDGLQCSACVWLIEHALEKQPGIVEARVNLTTKRLILRWRGDATDGAQYAALIQRLGYRAVPYEAQRAIERGVEDERRLLRALAVAGFAAANVMLLSISVWAGIDGDMGWATRDLMHWVSALIALPAIAYAGQTFFASACRALKHGRTNMDVPISIGVVLVSAISLYETIIGGTEAYFESATMLLFFLLIGRYLDLRARGKARSAVEQLLRLAAQPASVVSDGSIRRLPASAVAIGATVLVAAGERIVVDGRVCEGRSSVDKSLIDGETLPADITPGAMVHAGMLNLTAPLRVTVTATGESTFLAEIVRLMEIAERGRSRLVALADRVARLYAPVVHSLALVTFIGWTWVAGWQIALLNAVSVLIITCPCALGLAVPAAQIVTSGRLMRRGILLKSATALERLANVDSIAFDKTGTLTLGRLALQRDGVDETALRLASSLAAASRHPLSQALRAACPEAPALPAVTEHPGEGLSTLLSDGEARLGSRAFCGVASGSEDGKVELWLSSPGHVSTRFAFADTLRPDAAQVIGALKEQGKRVMLLSGDRPAVVARIAASLGIDDWRASLTPERKCAALAECTGRGEKVLMVGDGLNDAPALAAAYVSISPASGADVSQAAADVVFQGSSLSAVTETLDAARRGARIVRENIGFAIAYNALAVPLAMAGAVTPLIAAVAMSASSIIVVANALRLYGWKT